MIVRLSALIGMLVVAAAANAAASVPSLAELEWDMLAKSLQKPTSLQVLLDDGPKIWQEQCAPVYAGEGYPYFWPTGGNELTNGSHWQLVDQPAGLCSHDLSCAFQHCDWAPKSFAEINSDMEEKGNLDVTSDELVLTSIQDYVDYDSVPKESWNLPAAVVFPQTANDVVQAVKFATTNGIGMSVKTTGHSWSGSGMDQDSLMLNMRQYPKYLAQDGYLMECNNNVADGMNEGTDDDFTTDQLREQACRVAVSRGWNAIMRVGGGNLWDEAYRSLSEWNRNTSLTNDSGNWTYHIVGGSAGTVGAAGGWMLQTGLSGSTGMRKFGFGVDQVTQLEMILPTGQHVRFGPTEWQNDDTLAFPRTTKVTGWCNKDPSLPEGEWTWHVCNEDDDIQVSFDDLWHANRGGGGGFGVVLSVEYQLPDWPGPVGKLDLVPPADIVEFMAANPAALYPFLGMFLLNALWNPQEIGLSFEDSNMCGKPYLIPGTFDLQCFGTGGAAYATAFQNEVEKGKEYIMSLGLTEDQVTALGKSLIPNVGGAHNDYAEQGLNGEMEIGGMAGRLSSYPKPMLTFPGGPMTMSSLVPRDFVNSDQGRAIILGLPKLSHYLMGGNTATHHDGTTATSQAYREAAFWDYFADVEGVPSFAAAEILAFSLGGGAGGNSSDGTPQDSFPPMGGSFNHLGDSAVGPTKANWTKQCPPLSDTFSRTDRDEMCVDKLEFIFGTEGLARLEAIKKAVDPNHLFNCYGCVGYREKESDGSDPEGDEASSGEPFVSKQYEGTDTSSSASFYQESTVVSLVAFVAGFISCMMAVY